MLIDQKFQPEGICERAGEAIYPIQLYPYQIRGESSNSGGDQGVNQWNAKQNIQCKRFLEFGKKEIEVTLPTAEESVAIVSIR